MKKLFKVISALLIAIMIFQSVPVSAKTKLSLTKTARTLYVGGCKGAKASGKKAPYYSFLKVRKIVKNFSTETMDIKLSSSDKAVASTSNSTDKIKAVSMGTADVTVKVYSKRTKKVIFTDTIKITVKKNSNDETFTVKGLTDGATYAAGEKAAVTLSRKNIDTDKRSLTCDSSDVLIEATNSAKTTYDVTFKKPGTYKIVAAAYQSTKYNRPTASKTLTVTVASSLAAAQVTTRSFELSGSAVTDTLKASDLRIYTKIGDVALENAITVDTVSVTDGVATVTAYSAFTPDTLYYIDLGGETAEFTAVKDTPDSVTSFEIATTKVIAGTDTQLKFKYFAGTVDITESVDVLLTPGVTVECISGSDYTIVNLPASILIFESGKKAEIKASLPTGYDAQYNIIYLTATGTIESYEAAVPGYTGTFISTFTEDDGAYMVKTDAQKSYFALNDYTSFEALFLFDDDKYRTLDEMGITVDVSDKSIALVTGRTTSGGYNISGLNTGSCQLLLYKDKSFIAAVPFEVKANRYAKSISAELDKNVLNLNSLLFDQIKLTATVYDQYGDILKDEPIGIEQTPQTVAATGTVSFSPFTGNTLYIKSTQVALTGTQNAVIATVSCGAAKTSVTFYVRDIAYDSADLPKYVFSLEVDGPSTIDTALTPGMQSFDSSYVITYVKSHQSEGDYLVEEGMAETLYETPTRTKTAADYGLADGESRLFTTISLNGKVIDSDPCIYPDMSSIEFVPVISGRKLATGTYSVNLYLVTAQGTSVAVRQVAQKSISVVDSTPAVIATMTADTAKVATGTPIELIVTKCFTFTYDGIEIPASAISAVDSKADINGNTYIKSVTFTITNSEYGAFECSATINKSIKVINN